MEHLEEAAALHRRCLVIDGHADSILMVLSGERSLTERSDKGHIDWPRAREGGLACTVQAAWIDPVYYPVAPRRALEAIDGLLTQIAEAEGVRLVLRADDVTEAHAAGELAVLLNIEGAEPLQGSLALLRSYYRLGVRMMGLVWNHRNEVAEGVGEPESGGGLTRFGREVVREMNRLGMLIDLAHITPAGFFQVLELSEDPVLFTHGNCQALCEHPRNLTDEQIRALAAKGGVFGVSFVASFMGKETATLETVADHIDHVCQLLGNADHVGLGSDFDGATTPPGLEDVTCLPRLTAELMRRGYGEEDLAKILGGNYLRVFRQVLR